MQRPSKKMKAPFRTKSGIRGQELWLTQLTTKPGVAEVKYEPGGVTVPAPGATLEGLQDDTAVITMIMWEPFLSEQEWHMCTNTTGWKVARRWFDLYALGECWDNPLTHTFRVTPQPMGHRKMSVAVRVMTDGLPKIKKKASMGGMLVWVPDPTPPPDLRSPKTRVYWDETMPSKDSLAAARARMATIPAEKVQGPVLKQDGRILGVQVAPGYYVAYLKELHGGEGANKILFQENARAFIIHQVPHQIGAVRPKELLGSAGWGSLQARSGRPDSGGKSWMVLAADDPPQRRIGFAQREGAPLLREWEANAELLVVDKEQRERKERQAMAPAKAATTRRGNVPKWAEEWQMLGKAKASWERTYAEAIKAKPAAVSAKEDTKDDGDVEMDGGGHASTGTTTSPQKGKPPKEEPDAPPNLAAMASNPENLTKYLKSREDTLLGSLKKMIATMQSDITRDLRKDLKADK